MPRKKKKEPEMPKQTPLTRIDKIRILENQLTDIELRIHIKKDELKSERAEWDAKLERLRREITGNPNQEEIFGTPEESGDDRPNDPDDDLPDNIDDESQDKLPW